MLASGSFLSFSKFLLCLPVGNILVLEGTIVLPVGHFLALVGFCCCQWVFIIF